ncbi:hypothetical protein GIB67_011175 [Kingdonia uniflora]|uniref:Uncharacterized protein n=1 Tax=Kingdonia uniflora TaxID=39325 RepID=A0A7J7NCA4_9MAGN|nr:hypothetical protein GIB67_011175 [Kingdonia uniflora]
MTSNALVVYIPKDHSEAIEEIMLAEQVRSLNGESTNDKAIEIPEESNAATNPNTVVEKSSQILPPQSLQLPGRSSMVTEIYELFTFHETVDGLWVALSEMYSTFNNEVRVYELYKEFGQASQGSSSVTAYFGYLKKRFNIAPLPNLDEPYALIEKHERHMKLTSKVTVVSDVPPLVDQMSFAANSRSQSEICNVIHNNVWLFPANAVNDLAFIWERVDEVQPQLAVNIIVHGATPNWTYRRLVKEILILKNSFEICEVLHQFRETNKAADLLARPAPIGYKETDPVILESPKSGTNKGALAGIIVGAIACVIALFAIAALLIAKRRGGFPSTSRSKPRELFKLLTYYEMKKRIRRWCLDAKRVWKTLVSGHDSDGLISEGLFLAVQNGKGLEGSRIEVFTEEGGL